MKPKVKAIYTLYRHGKLTKAQVHASVPGSTDGGGVQDHHGRGVHGMTEVICAALTGFCAIVCAVIASQASKREKREKTEQERLDRRAEQRAKEGRLQLAMIDANCKLTVGVAMALKRGHCNGEVEQGLAAIQKTQRDYEQLEEHFKKWRKNNMKNENRKPGSRCLRRCQRASVATVRR